MLSTVARQSVRFSEINPITMKLVFGIMEKRARLICIDCFKVGKFLSEVLFVLSILFIMYIFTMIASDLYLTKAGNKLSDTGVFLVGC